MMKQCPTGMLEFNFQQLGILISIVKHHIRNFLNAIFLVIQEFWTTSTAIQITILSLVKSVALSLDLDFKIYLPVLLPQILSILDSDMSEKRTGINQVLNVLVIFGNNLEEYLHLVVPSVVKLFERTDLPLATRKAAIFTIAEISKKVNFNDQASRILHPLIRVISSGEMELKISSLDCLCSFIHQFGNDFVIFLPILQKVHNITSILNNERIKDSTTSSHRALKIFVFGDKITAK